ncbi:hypothetical protein ILUMI_23488 [Ignelater luminosus]|uniref:procollagen-proline 4-dioxygenase n=1 Tax=Ignelater luminosus TaxID=2038154 RepID=A0A8K0CCD1_IGNLU|nr:hypothetical protein ILUMI_23488 [Ignelater luminosus]
MCILYNLVGILLLMINRNVRCEVYTSVAVLEDVINTETKIISSIEEYIRLESEKLDHLNRYMKRYQEQNNLALRNIEDYLENPLNIYLLIKRLTVELQAVEDLIGLNNVEKVSSNLDLYKNRTDFPTVQDFNGTIRSLAVMQDVYRLNTSAFASGQLGKFKYDTELSSWDCIQFGNHYYEKEYYNYSHSWFEEGKNRFSRKFNEFGETNAHLNYVQARIKEMDEIFRKNNSLVNHEDRETELFGEHCRKDMTPPIEILSKLKCKYVTNNKPYLLIAPFKVEEISMKPRILRFYNVMSDSEIEKLKELAYSRFETAKISRKGIDLALDSSRLAKVAWISKTTHECVAKISERISDMTGLTTRTSEPLQTSNYGVGGYFKSHWDFAHPKFFNISTLARRNNGNRIATLLFYMNEVSQGGHTVFPLAGVIAKPIKGSAVVWYNLYPSGDADNDTRHAACPVLTGTKWVSNKWLYEYGQEFLRPCELDPHATGYDFFK